LSIAYLAPDGNDANSCGTPATRCASLGRGLAQLAAGGELRLASGIYTGRNTLTRSATIAGGYGLPDFLPGTAPSILDGQQLGSTLQITGAISVRLAQLTITGGAAATTGISTGRGGGIYISGAAVVLDRVLVHHNIAAMDGPGEGGGIYVRDGNLTLANSQVLSNTAVLLHALFSPFDTAGQDMLPQPIQSIVGGGGGIFASNARVAIRRSTLIGNTVLGGTAAPMLQTSAAGGALYADTCMIDTLDTQFLRNDAQALEGAAGALKLLDSQVRLRGGEISDNRAGPAGSVAGGGALDIVGGQASLTNIALRRNQATDGAGIRLLPSAELTTTAQLTLTNVLLADHAGAALALPALQAGKTQAEIRHTSLISNSVGVLAGSGQAISITNSLLISNTVATRAITGSLVTLSYTDRYANARDADGAVQIGPAGGLALPPHFKPADADFHLAPDSPLIDRGSPLADITTDFEGQPRSFDGDGNGTVLPDLGWDEMVRSVAQFGPNQTLFAQPGQTLTATLDLYNVGLAGDTFKLSVSAPSGWVVGVQPPQVALGPRTQQRLTIRISVPASAANNSQTSLLVRAIGELSQASATLLVVVEKT
jgi:hypothetical protein